MNTFAGEDVRVRAGVLFADDQSTAVLELSCVSREAATEQVGLFSMLNEYACCMRVDTQGPRLKLMAEFYHGWVCVVEADVSSPEALGMFMKIANSGRLLLSIGIHQDVETFLPMVVFMINMTTCAVHKISSQSKEVCDGLDRLV